MAGGKFKFHLLFSRYITSKRLLRHFKSASYKDGFLIPSFNEYRMEKTSRVCFARDANKKFVGWGFLFKEEDKRLYSIMLFIKKEFRRKGVGSEIIRLLSKGHMEIEVSPHDNKSRKFFYKCQEVNRDVAFV